MENQQKNSAPENNSDNRNSNNNNNKKKPSKTVVIWIVSILLTFMIWQGITAIQQSKQEKITYDTFLQMLDDKLVTEVKLYNDRISFTPISKETGAEMDKTYYVIRISDYKIVDRLQKAGVQFEEMDEGKNAVVSTILSYVVMIGAFYLLMSLLMRNMSKSGGIGKSNVCGEENRCDIRGCCRSGGGKGISLRDGGFLRSAGPILKDRCEAAEGCPACRASGNR